MVVDETIRGYGLEGGGGGETTRGEMVLGVWGGGANRPRVKNRGVTNRGKTTWGETTWGRNVLLPVRLPR